MTTRTRPVVAIDGPAGAGKSTVTQLVAERLGYILVNTGALYRTVALAAIRRGVSFGDVDALGHLANELARTHAIRLVKATGSRAEQGVLLNGEDVSEAIREQSVGYAASQVSAVPSVREALLALQRNAGQGGGVVLEGRDIGTVVFPDAEAKFFLTASVAVRARRRHEELLQKGETTTLAEVEKEVSERDRRDTSRPISPLRQAADAVVVDSSELGADAVADSIVARVREVEQRLAAR